MKIIKAIPIMLLGLLNACSLNSAFYIEEICDDSQEISDDPFEEPEYERDYKLVSASSCEDAETQLKQSLTGQMKADLLYHLHDFLERKQILASECYWGDSDTDSGDYSDGDADGDWDNGGEESAEDYSETNNQVDGVDEADFVKNDGSYIYILADGFFQILDAWPAEDAHRISSFEIEGDPKKMFVHGDRVLVYSSLDPIPTNDPIFQQAQWMEQGGYECTYGYDCDFVGDGRQLKVTILDITDLEKPSLVRETLYSGSYVNARRIGNSVFTVSAFPSPVYDTVLWSQLRWIPEELANNYGCGCDIPYTSQEITALFIDLFEKNQEKIQSFSHHANFPVIRDKVYAGQNSFENENQLVDCGNFYLSHSGDGYGFLSVTAVDLTEDDSFNSTTIMGRPGAVYSDADTMYVANRHYGPQMDWWFDEIEGEEATVLHKFDLTTERPGVNYAASGVAKGRVLNQFAMDEYEENLRVATTTGFAWGSTTHSTVSVLAEENDILHVIGLVDNIAPTEDIRSVRFKGDVGFVVTFKKTDPLFVIGLEDPANPEILGELKIPGFSTYMHLMDETHLLSIGFDAEDMDSFAWFEGIQLQIINYSDLANPELIHKEVIGTRGTASEAANNHLAFNYFGSRDLLALPMVICEESDGGGSYGEYMSFSGLMVYNVTSDQGFTRLGGISHDSAGYPWGEEDWWGDGTCYQWWSSMGTPVKRSIFMENFVYSIAPEEIRIADVNDLSELLNTVSLTL